MKCILMACLFLLEMTVMISADTGYLTAFTIVRDVFDTLTFSANTNITWPVFSYVYDIYKLMGK